MKITILITIICSASILLCQNNDFVWNMGHIGCENEPYDTSVYCRYAINFNNDPASLDCDRDRKFELAGTNSFYCKDNGSIFCVSNGMQIYNRNNSVMKNGQSISLNGFWNYSVIKNACGPGLDIIRGYYMRQANLFLPWPNDKNKLLYIAARYEVISERAEGAWYCVIDMTKNNGLGEVVEKDVDLFEEDIAFCFRTAVRHVNGVDWWLTFPTLDGSEILVYLFDEHGLHFSSRQMAGPPYIQNVGGPFGQSYFSPDGSKFAIAERYNWNERVIRISLYDFDRKAGVLSNRREAKIFPDFEQELGVGLCFSPSGEFLYANTSYELYQFKTNAQFSQSKKLIALQDGYWSILPQFITDFGYMQNGPDGKIYMVPANSTTYLHRIEYPDEEGKACDFRQHVLKVYNTYESIPNFPNYRLGPLDNSDCDTLGLDNNPIAKFRYEADTTDHLRVRFTDLSYYRPETWHWNFGDGTTFDGKKPYWHSFPKNGVYNVCLTVSNENSENTSCRMVTIGSTSTLNPQSSSHMVNVFPNPTEGEVLLTLSDYIPEHGVVEVYDVTGKLVHTSRIYYGWNNLDLTNHASGIYTYVVKDGVLKISEGKIVKI